MFSDTDWASCLYPAVVYPDIVSLWATLVSWKTKKQPTISWSSTKSEYWSMAAATTELLWLSYILAYLWIQFSSAIKLFYDNRSSELLVANPCFHHKSKHFLAD